MAWVAASTATTFNWVALTTWWGGTNYLADDGTYKAIAAWWNWPIVSWSVAGTQIVADILEIPVSNSITAATFRISLKTQPSWTDFIAKLYKNWVEDASATITTAQSATNGLYQATDTTFVSWSYVAWDVLKVGITQIGSSVAWSDFTFSLTE